jgi:MFS family permease
VTATVDAPLPHRFRAGSVRAAWSYRDFRLLWTGQALSQTGTWMQNVALPAYVQARWHSGALVGVMVFAQMGPTLLFAIPGSVLANRLPRKPWLVAMPTVQMLAAFALAILVSHNVAYLWLFVANAAMGIGFALNNPAFMGTLPTLVDTRDIPGAVSLYSAQLNGTRVLGPLLVGAMTLLHLTVSQMLIGNGLTFLFVVAAVLMADIPSVRHATDEGWRALTTGLRIARSRPVMSRLLLTMFCFSFLCLPFVGLFPTVAEMGFRMHPRSPAYSWLFASFGAGALLGGLSVGSIFVRTDRRRLIPPALVGFAAMLFTFGMLRSAVPAYPVAFVLGAFYFCLATAINTEFQTRMDHSERVFLMALWFMAFGGTVPLGNLLFGPILDHVGPRWVLGIGALAALGLARWCNLVRLETRAAA